MLLNTTYDEVEENEDKWSDLAESLELSQMDYKLVVRRNLPVVLCFTVLHSFL